MYDSTSLSISANSERSFNYLLLLYPEQYRKRFGQEMRLVFLDMYQEELAKKGKITLEFYFSIAADLTKSIIGEHITEIERKGIKKYLSQTLHMNKLNIIGVLLILPFFSLLLGDFLTRMTQGDLLHYNKAYNSFISHLILATSGNGKYPALWMTLLIFFPIVSIILNLFGFVKALVGNKKKLNLQKIMLANPFAIIFMCFGFFLLLIAFGHDVIPCIVSHIFSQAHINISQIYSICRQA